jgi:hypothetical protein
MLPPNVQAGDCALMLYAPPDVTSTETPAGDINVTPVTKVGVDTSTKSASKRATKSSRRVRLTVTVIDFFIMLNSTVLLVKTRFE